VRLQGYGSSRVRNDRQVPPFACRSTQRRTVTLKDAGAYPNDSEVLSLPILGSFGWSITHQHQDCISGKQSRGVEEMEKHSNIGSDQQFEDMGGDQAHKLSIGTCEA